MTSPSDSSAYTPIAVIAVACRFPDADTPEIFWRNLLAGVESIRHFSPAELETLAGATPPPGDQRWVPAGAVLNNVDQFDAGFFGFIPRHAELLDPQQRLLLECAWEALERAGYCPDSYPGAVGVYASIAKSSYSQGPLHAPVERLVAYAGEDKDFAATRISYKLNLTGPSVVVQSASSSSLTAVHLACESLLAGECDLALAGGACISFPQAGYVYDEALMLSPDGHCRAFDAEGAGTVTGNGVGLVALKLLSDAMADGDPILAVIRGSALGNDGAQKVDFFAPSIDGQARVIREAQAMASVDPAAISYIEAHGTGTALGDPIEIEALRQAFAGSQAIPGSCAIGSVKTNIGHLHTAAGVAGLIKTVLMLQHGWLAPSLNYRQPNPRIPFAETPFQVNTESRPWTPPPGQPRLAGVSAFGFGGTNAHLVLEEAPATLSSDLAPPWQLLILSARDDAALRQASERLANYLSDHPEVPLADVAYTLQVGRKTFVKRRWIVCRDLAGAIAALRNPVSAGAGVEAADVPGAASALCAAIAAWMPVRGEAELEQNWRRLGELWASGATIPWATAYTGQRRQRLALPTYPFQRRRYWASDSPRPQAGEGPGVRVSDFTQLNAWSRWRWRQALTQQGAWAVGDSTAIRDLIERWRALPRYQRLLETVQGWLAEPEDRTMDWANWRTQAQASAMLAPWLPLIDHCADQFLKVIRGERPATEILFPHGSAEAVAAIYHSPPLQALNRQLADEVVNAVTRRWAAGVKPVRILEVGAGTGATSRVVWSALAKALAAQGPDVELEYVFSDLSPSLTQQARRQYSATYPWVRFETLDIEAPISHGEGAFDLILSAHVLHATRDIRRALTRLRQRLTPEGLLLLAETVEPQDCLTLTFGLLDGWWLFADADLRLTGSPLLDASTWQAELTRQGFAEVAVHTSVGDGLKLALVTARATESHFLSQSPVEPPRRFAPHLLIQGGESGKPFLGQGGESWGGVVRDVLAEVLGITVEEIVDDRPFAALGVDSIVAPLFASALNRRLAANLRPTDL
ncbi:MAG: hypothetical protein QG599_441, partial [Pseudomonadota bacterium]|nr:hypothetical protein [Pseudomonadota bacterium]